jgi:2,4-dienoyl-CoA reductase-like NADH-dependent reductase (Old Yellow Enzyme family)
MSSVDFIKIPTLRSVEAFRQALAGLGIDLPCDDAAGGPGTALAKPIETLGRTVANRFCIQPMEGWDGTPDGRPTELTFRRWRRFGMSGAGLIWGGEAVAVRHAGRANPRQLVLNADTAPDIARLREALIESHRSALEGACYPPLIGLQLTHSGRFSRPNAWDRPEPVIAYHHPILDRRLGIGPEYPIIPDPEVRRLIEDYARAARLAQRCGFDFVDIKHCHGYLGHEFLSAFTRPGDYGGTLDNRTRFLREIVEAVRAEAPGLGIGVRLSVFDTVPYEPDPYQAAPGRLGPGIPANYCDCVPYVYGFGVDQEQPTEVDLTEPMELFGLLRRLGISFVNVTAGSPYYSHHIQRPALYPPSDGYQPPEDPLVGVARLMHVTRYLKQAHPDFALVGTGYTYLQEFLPHVAQAAVRDGWTDFVGLGRMALAYPELPADVLAGRPLQRKRICRTFSDCTTAPRAGIVSGCYPLDEHYRRSEFAAKLNEVKAQRKSKGEG